MKLTIEDLKRRHEFWRLEIGKTGIWEASKFKPVEFLIRKSCKSYHGMFQRRWKKGDKKNTLRDRIVIYCDSDKFDDRFVNSVLVHEMIHQYIIQNDMPDTSSHGYLFKTMMTAINNLYKEHLEIKIRGESMISPESKAGDKYYTLLIMEEADSFFCGVVSQSRVSYFNRLIKNHFEAMKLRSFSWALSNDVFFSHFRRSTMKLTGVRRPLGELETFIKEHLIVIAKKMC